MSRATDDALPLAPLGAPPDQRPRSSDVPCDACGKPVDPLRAEVVLAFDDGMRFLCDASCERAHREGRRTRRVPTPIGQSVVPRPTPGRGHARVLSLPAPALPATDERGMALGAALVGIAALFGLFGSEPWAAVTSTLASALAVGCASWMSLAVIRDAGWLAWSLGPAGALLAGYAAAASALDGRGSTLGVEGAALCALAVLVRTYLDRRAREPVDAAVAQLAARLPVGVHVPVPSARDPLAFSMQLVDAQSIRAGEEIIATRGETLAVDGVVQAGHASVLPYPRAVTPVVRIAGDALLAGATVVEGALRVLTTRVGDERSLARIARLGSRLERDPGPLARVSRLVSRFGGAGTLALAATVLLLADSTLPAAPLAAASAVLLAAPLWSLRRVAQLPPRAAAAAAGARGIVFQGAAALDATGRATTVAMSPHGVLTERSPVVVDLHVLEGGEAGQLVALATAAERSAGSHPVARAIERFAAERKLPELEVRRPVHHRGRGVTAISPQGQTLVVGSRRLLLEEGISVAAADAEAARAEQRQRTPVFIALDGRVRAVLSLQYELRLGARPAIQRMFDSGLEVVLLTGDQLGSVSSLASGLDIHHVKAELSPDERGQQVERLRDAGGVVAALGFPSEDDAVLAAADAGIVLASAGGAATERAVALVSDDVRDAAAALWIARIAREAAWRAVGVAGIAFAVVVAAAATGLIVPGVAALLTAAVDAYCLPAGARLLRRIALRLPSRS